MNSAAMKRRRLLVCGVVVKNPEPKHLLELEAAYGGNRYHSNTANVDKSLQKSRRSSSIRGPRMSKASSAINE